MKNDETTDGDNLSIFKRSDISKMMNDETTNKDESTTNSIIKKRPSKVEKIQATNTFKTPLEENDKRTALIKQLTDLNDKLGFPKTKSTFILAAAHFTRVILTEKNVIGIVRVFKEICFVVLLLERSFVAMYSCQIDRSVTSILNTAQLNYFTGVNLLPCGQKYMNEVSNLEPDMTWADSSLNVSDPFYKDGFAIWSALCQVQEFQAFTVNRFTIVLVIFEMFALAFFVFREKLSTPDFKTERTMRKITVILLSITSFLWFIYEFIEYITIVNYPQVHCWLPGYSFFRSCAAGYVLLTVLYLVAVYAKRPIDTKAALQYYLLRQFMREKKILKKSTENEKKLKEQLAVKIASYSVGAK